MMGRKDKQRDLISKILRGPEQKGNMKKLDPLTEFRARSFGGQLPRDVAERGLNEKLAGVKDMLQDEREKKQVDRMRLAATVRRQQKKQDKKLAAVRDVLEDKIEKKYSKLAATVRRQQKKQSDLSAR